jgi:hypothetical protein
VEVSIEVGNWPRRGELHFCALNDANVTRLTIRSTGGPAAGCLGREPADIENLAGDLANAEELGRPLGDLGTNRRLLATAGPT